MSEDALRQWDIGKLEIKPGDLLIFRYHRRTFPSVGPAGYTQKEPPEMVDQIFEAARPVVREALDKVGLTDDKVPVLFITEDWDIHAISPLDLMDKCVTAERAKDAFDQSSNIGT